MTSPHDGLSAHDALVRRELLPLSQPYIAPRTPTEQTLAEIWRVALGMDRVGVDDDYAELGGDSFLATVIFARIEQVIAVPAPIGLLADASTVAQLAQRLDAITSCST